MNSQYLNEAKDRSSKTTVLHRGVWSVVENNMSLPVGGSVFSPELTVSLQLDFSEFQEFGSREKIHELYLMHQQSFDTWFELLPIDLKNSVAPEEYFTLIAVQNGVRSRLNLPVQSEVDVDTDTDAKKIEIERNRLAKYDKKTPKLSEFRDGTAFCAERASLAQWLLQQSGFSSAYMSGVTYFEDIADGSDHSWIVLHPGTEKSLILDIARPHNNLPNVYLPESPISEETFLNTQNAFLKTKKLLTNSERYF